MEKAQQRIMTMLSNSQYGATPKPEVLRIEKLFKYKELLQRSLKAFNEIPNEITSEGDTYSLAAEIEKALK